MFSTQGKLSTIGMWQRRMVWRGMDPTSEGGTLYVGVGENVAGGVWLGSIACCQVLRLSYCSIVLPAKKLKW